MIHRQVSLHYSSADGIVDVIPILEGDLDHLPPLSANVVRVFLSSTFSDMIKERNAIMEHSYPRLKDFCRDKFRLEFQFIDLRWGLREESQDNHTIIDFCIREIENCKKLSVGPCFVALLGQKYGFRTFPSVIEATKFETMREKLLRNGKDVMLLETWFKKDTNVLPHVYILQPISSIFKNYIEKDNLELQREAQDQWNKVFQQLQHLLRLGVMLCQEEGLLSQQDKDQFFISVTECEIEKGMLQSDNADSTSFCFTRQIVNLEENLDCPNAPKFIDMIPGTCKVDDDAQKMLSVLRNEKIPRLLQSSCNMTHFDVTWKDPVHAGPSDDPQYLNLFCDAFEQKMQQLITRSVQNLKSVSRNSQAVEILQHLSMCKARSLLFKGREEILDTIRVYLSQPTRLPLTLFGLSGSGKTSVLAKSASLLKEWFPDKKFTLVVRFLGTTAHCCSIRLVLGNLCWHLASIYGKDTQKIPGDYPSLVAYFHDILKCSTELRPLVIMLDSLDQLGQAHRAHNLAWLPKVIPPHVHIILSTLPYEHDILETLKMFVESPEYFVQVLPLGQQLGNSLIKEWLANSNRRLTPQQCGIVTAALAKCSLPLYTKLVFEEVCHWNSYSPLEQTQLEVTVKGIISKLFEKVERYHGQTFVKHALSYLTASKNGLSDLEMEDVLSLDDTVLNDVFQHWVPPIRRIPPLLLPRLHDELSSYIMQREASGTVVYYWYHRQFIFVAKDRYFTNVGLKMYIHSSLAHYFLGTWGGGQTKPFKYSVKQLQLMSTTKKEDEADRKVALQPLQFGPDPHQPTRINYNLRKLSELPFHLQESRMFSDLKRQVLLNYEWLHTKLSAMSLQDVLSDFRATIQMACSDPEVQLLSSALRVGGSYLNNNPNTLAFDLLGRLLFFYDMTKYINLKNLLQQCDTKSLKHSSVLPLFQCFDSPRAMLLYVLEDNSEVVIDLIFSRLTNELISVARGGMLTFWDLTSGECTRNIDISVLNPGPNTKLFQSKNGKYLVVDSDSINSPIYVYDLKTAQLLHSCGRRLPTQRRGFIAGNLFCRQKTIIDICEGKVLKNLDDFVKSRRYVSCGITNDHKYILIGEELVIKIFSFSDGTLLATVPGENLPSVFSVTDDCKRVYVGYVIDCVVKVLDMESASRTFGQAVYTFNYKAAFPHVKFLDGPQHGREIAEIAISPTSDNVVLLNLKRCHLILLDVQKEEARLMDTKPIHANNKTYFFNATFSCSGRYVIAGEDTNLHVWQADGGAFIHSVKIHSVGVFPMAVSCNQNFVATGSSITTAIKIWGFGSDRELRSRRREDVRMCARHHYVCTRYPIGFHKENIFAHESQRIWLCRLFRHRCAECEFGQL